jgi:Protein of unknown function (DUF2817)
MREAFSANYAEARHKFRDAATAAGAVMTSYDLPTRGPAGEELTTDVARVGPADARNVLMTVSATHGAEGFCGSGIQVAAFNGLVRELPPDTALLAVHAINPYGFSWIRRVTEENVDLNRNFIDHAEPLPENQGYEELAEAICPDEWTDAVLAAAQQRLDAYAAEHGAAALQRAMSGGQYRHADGIFYGGTGVTRARRTLERIVADHLSGARRLAVIDFHTGLGPYGYGEPIVMHDAGTAALQRCYDWYGDKVTNPMLGTSSSAELYGDNLRAFETMLPKVEFTGMALEYGTLPSKEVLLAVRADNWLHQRGDLGTEKARILKRQMRDAFYCDADDWKSMLVEQGITRQRQALAGLTQG